jgi:hypothetical protein
MKVYFSMCLVRLNEKAAQIKITDLTQEEILVMTERIMLLPNPPLLRDEEAAKLTEFLFDLAAAAEMHYSHQLRRHYRRKRTPYNEYNEENDSESF